MKTDRPAIELLTALAPGGIAVIRLHSSHAEAILARVARSRTGDVPIEFESDRLRLARLFDGEEMIDEAVIVRTPAGDVEICLHGGVRVVQRAMMLLERAADSAGTVEDLPNCDSLVAKIDSLFPRATTRRMARWLLKQRAMASEPRVETRGGREPFPESDHSQASTTRQTAAARLLRGARVAIVGPPNAGKSTLANALIGRDRVLTSDVPGTTRDWIDETALIRGWPITLTDTAGIRATNDSLEAASIQRGQAHAAAADLLLVVFDASTLSAAPTLADLKSDFAASSDVLIVLNKADLLHAGFGGDALLISARTGAGLDRLESAIEQALGFDLLSDDQLVITL